MSDRSSNSAKVDGSGMGVEDVESEKPKLFLTAKRSSRFVTPS